MEAVRASHDSLGVAWTAQAGFEDDDELCARAQLDGPSGPTAYDPKGRESNNGSLVGAAARDARMGEAGEAAPGYLEGVCAGPGEPPVARLSWRELVERVKVMLDTEGDCLPRPDYIEAVQHDDMRVVWRSKVASWLLEFEEVYGISQETIAVAVNYMDRYLSQVSTKKSILQLLAMGSVFVAAKLHETFPIGMSELRDLADGTYLESDIKLMELELLRVIQWKLNPVTPQSFMTHLVQFIRDPEARRAVHEDAITFLDVAIPEYEFLKFRPSVQAVAALLCAFETTRVPVEVPRQWTEAISVFGVLDERSVLECKTRMMDIFDTMVSPNNNANSGIDAAEQQLQSESRQPTVQPPVALVATATTTGAASGALAAGSCGERSETPTGVAELAMYCDDDVDVHIADASTSNNAATFGA